MLAFTLGLIQPTAAHKHDVVILLEIKEEEKNTPLKKHSGPSYVHWVSFLHISV